MIATDRATLFKTPKPHYKAIGYAYPSSPNAVQYGYSKAGCWCVMIESDNGIHTIGGYPTMEQARAVCDERPEPYSKHSL